MTPEQLKFYKMAKRKIEKQPMLKTETEIKLSHDNAQMKERIKKYVKALAEETQRANHYAE